MDQNENKEVEVEETEDIEDVSEDIEESDTTDWKAEALKARGIAKRYETKFKKLQEKPVAEAKTVEEKKVEKKGFDYGEKAYLRSSGIEPSEFDFVYEVMSNTGKPMEDVLESKYFQAELKERRDAKASKEALPSGSKRSGQVARDSVEYWLAKGELPPPDQRELRTKVVNARIKQQQDQSTFTDNPVV